MSVNLNALTTVECAMVLGVLRGTFPWLGTERSVSGADVVEDLNDLHKALRARVRVGKTSKRKGK